MRHTSTLPLHKEQTDFSFFTVCPRSLNPIYIVTYYLKWFKDKSAKKDLKVTQNVLLKEQNICA